MAHTLQDLEAIFRREVPHRPHWPQAWQAAQDDALTMAILRTMAAHPSASYGRRASVISEPMPLHWRPAAPHIKPARTLDFKSLAAGEKPEPEEP